MSFAQEMERYTASEIPARIAAVKERDVWSVLERETLSPEDFFTLLSPSASAPALLEAMAQRAHTLTLRHFGRTIQLFTPLYLSNYCTNQCVYCGFNTRNAIARDHLDPERIRREGEAIAATGLRNLLLLTGDAPKKASVEYIGDAARILRDLFPSIGVEVYSMREEEYAHLIACGVDSFTMFQETYNRELYPALHPAGPKKDYAFRLDAPERACRAGMRTVNIGALLGLDEWRRDGFFTGLHAWYLQRRYPQTDIAVSLPRMRPHAGAYQPVSVASDRDLVQYLLALRLFLPRCGITLSSRESAELRDWLIPLGVTKVSAGVSTAVGGHAASAENAAAQLPNEPPDGLPKFLPHTATAASGVENSPLGAICTQTARQPDTSDEVHTNTVVEPEHAVVQFAISDSRGVDAMCAAIRAQGYQPVFKDWEPLDGLFQSPLSEKTGVTHG